MGDKKETPKPSPDRLAELERQAEEIRRKVAEAEREANDTLERAEELEDKSRELGEASDEIRRKAHEPIGFPPAKRVEKGKPERKSAGDD
jgi:chromosome segregation ATPase